MTPAYRSPGSYNRHRIYHPSSWAIRSPRNGRRSEDIPRPCAPNNVDTSGTAFTGGWEIRLKNIPNGAMSGTMSLELDEEDETARGNGRGGLVIKLGVAVYRHCHRSIAQG